MKSFIVALVLFLCVTLFTVLNSIYHVHAIDEMIALAESLPKTAEGFRLSDEKTDAVAKKLISLWDEKFPSIVFTSGYENTNRCDTAIGSFSVSYENGGAPDCAVALSEFLDGLKRLRILESFSLQGIF